KENGRLPCWRRLGGRSSTEAIRSAARALTYLPPRRSRSKTIARVCPSCSRRGDLLADTLSLRLLGQALTPGARKTSRLRASGRIVYLLHNIVTLNRIRKTSG